MPLAIIIISIYTKKYRNYLFKKYINSKFFIIVMKRKLNLVGQNTLTVSLPSRWTKKLNLKKGDELEVSEESRGLLISAEGRVIEKEATIDITNMKSSSVWRNMKALYQAGYSQITVMFSSPFIINNTSRRDIKNEPEKIEVYFLMTSIAGRLEGMKIIKHGLNKLIIKETSKLDPKNLDLYIKRILDLIVIISEESYNAFKKNDTDTLRNILFLDEEVNALSDTCLRMVNTYLHTDEEVVLLVPIIVLLERIGDDYISLLKHYFSLRQKLTKEELYYFKKVNDASAEFQKIYVTKQGNIADYQSEVINLRQELKKAIEIYKSFFLTYLKVICEQILEMLHLFYYYKIEKKQK